MQDIVNLSSYLRLVRLHQPVGIWLLLWPCLWSAAMASVGLPDVKILVLFAIGAVLMRSAGCIVNDIADKDFDKQVERTRMRPLASGELKVPQAVALLVILLAASLLVAMELGVLVVLWGALALFPVAMYPLMKRVSWWPQLFLGLTFNWGALMGWVAVHGELAAPAFLLYAGGVCWSLGYDTIYAHQDKIDDARIGVRSTALRLGEHTKKFVSAMYACSVLLWGYAGQVAGLGVFYIAGMVLIAAHFFWQVKTVDLDDSSSSRAVFFSNAWLGAVVFALMIISKALI